MVAGSVRQCLAALGLSSHIKWGPSSLALLAHCCLVVWVMEGAYVSLDTHKYENAYLYIIQQ